MVKVKKRKVKRQSRKMERVSSGVEGFDKMTEGGFEKNSVNLVVGDSGSGKTIFALQFLIDGLMKGEGCLYITFEEKKEEFYKNMMNFGWNMAEYEKQGKFFFLEYNPEKVKVMIEEGGGEIENVVVKKSVSRLVIDSVTSFALLFEDELQKREAALSLFDIIRRWKCTSILTLQENPLDRSDGASTSLEFEADSIILIYFIREKKERQRFIEVLKMRGTKHSATVHSLKFSDKGLYVSEEILADEIK